MLYDHLYIHIFPVTHTVSYPVTGEAIVKSYTGMEKDFSITQTTVILKRIPV